MCVRGARLYFVYNKICTRIRRFEHGMHGSQQQINHERKIQTLAFFCFVFEWKIKRLRPLTYSFGISFQKFSAFFFRLLFFRFLLNFAAVNIYFSYFLHVLLCAGYYVRRRSRRRRRRRQRRCDDDEVLATCLRVSVRMLKHKTNTSEIS